MTNTNTNAETSTDTSPMEVYVVDEVAEVMDRMDPDCGCLHGHDCPEVNRAPGWEDAVRTGATGAAVAAGIALGYLGLDALDPGEYLLTSYLTVPVIAAVAITVGAVAGLVTRFRPTR